MNNLNKKYKPVKDKSKSTGEGSDEIESFPEFTDLDELWGTRDTVTNKYVVEAGSNDQPIDETSTEEVTMIKVKRKTLVLTLPYPLASVESVNSHWKRLKQPLH